MTRVLTERELNRALLARQMLLEPDADRAPLDAIRHLCGVQAQEPRAPYFGLHARLADFDPAAAETLLEDRDTVRVNVMRHTIHLVPADEAKALRELHAPMLRTRMTGAIGRDLAGADLEAVAAAATPLFAAEPVGMKAVGDAIAPRFPGADPTALGLVAATVVPVVHTTPRGLWHRTGRAKLMLLDRWLEGRAHATVTAAALLRRYLAAFGPATPADFTAFTGLPAAKALFDAHADALVTYEDERGRTLFDLPGAPLPPADTPAPPRLLGEFDNALLGHADRARILPHANRSIVVAGLRAVLLDGYAAGAWTATDGAVEIETFAPTSAAEKRALREEARRLPVCTGRVAIRSGSGRRSTATPTRSR